MQTWLFDFLEKSRAFRIVKTFRERMSDGFRREKGPFGAPFSCHFAANSGHFLAFLLYKRCVMRGLLVAKVAGICLNLARSGLEFFQ